MNKTKFRSLGLGFLISAILLIVSIFAWPFVPNEWKVQLASFNLPIVKEDAVANSELKASYDSVVAESTSNAASYASAMAQQSNANKDSSSSSSQTAENSSSASSTAEPGTPKSFTIAEGESSYQVAENLAAAGLISNATEFLNYLDANGYTVWSGTYELTPNMTHEQLAQALGSN